MKQRKPHIWHRKQTADNVHAAIQSQLLALMVASTLEERTAAFDQLQFLLSELRRIER